MEYFFWSVLLFGMGMVLFVIRACLQWTKKRKIIIESEEVHYRSNTENAFDYKAIIIQNDVVLSFLQKTENSIRIKLSIFCGCGAALVIANYAGLLALEMKGLAISWLLILIVVIILPGILIKSMITTQTGKMLDALPYFIDLIAVCVQSGMTVESAIKFISQHAQELDKNLAMLMGYLIKRAEVSGLEDGLLDLYRAMDMAEMRMFCSILQQSVHYGTSLYENLMELSKDIRELQLLSSEEKIGKLSAKISVPLILFIMFPITVLIAAPGILRILKNGIF